MVNVRLGWGLALIAAAAGLSACRSPAPTNNPATLAADQLVRGEPIYAQGCATEKCHGTDSEGIPAGDSFTAWPLVGELFQQRNPNAQVVFDVVRSGNEPNLRQMTDQEVYDAIAYELSLNGVAWSEPLMDGNAAGVSGVGMAGSTGYSLYPPLDGVVLLPGDGEPSLPFAASSHDLRLQVDQIARASAIGAAAPPEESVYLIVAFALKNQTGEAIDVGPESLRLDLADGVALHPENIQINAAIAQFYTRSLEAGHSTAGLAIFTLPADGHSARLVYDDGSRAAVAVELAF